MLQYMRALFQQSKWEWSDGKNVSYIDWGLGHQPFPKTSSFENAYFNRTALFETPKVHTQRSPHHHCTAFEMSPDFSQISMFPINCAVRYHSRILCEENRQKEIDEKASVSAKRRNEPWHGEKDSVKRENELPSLASRKQTPKSPKANGGYYIAKNTLYQRQYVCPDGYFIFFDDFCIKLILNRVNVLKYGIGLNSKCKNSDVLEKINHGKDVNYDPIYRILEEYYPEGADIVTGRKANVTDLYMWLPPSLYPTYVPCFTRKKEREENENTGRMELYTCEDGSVIPDALVCDGKGDCLNSEDERHCSVCSELSSEICFKSCFFPACLCSMFYYQCDGGGCVHYDQVCDMSADCPHGDDERYCHKKKHFPNFDEKFVRKSYLNVMCDPLLDGLLVCRSSPQCFNSSAICHYDHSGGMMAHCEDGSHLGKSSLCQFIECIHHYKCFGSYCIPTRKICDGVSDCPVGDDEAHCEMYSCPGQMRCTGVTFCVPAHEICDGVKHCPQQEDEKYCQVCPEGCQCKGTALFCDGLESLSIGSALEAPSALYLYNSHVLFTELYMHHQQKTQHVFQLSLQGSPIGNLLEDGKNDSQNFLSVKVLNLNYLGLYVVGQYFMNAPNMISVNLSYNDIHTVQRHAFDLMRNVKLLSLVSNELQNLESHFCSELGSLVYLYLSENPLIYVASGVFLKNSGLSMIRSDL